MAVACIGAPSGFRDALAPLPAGVRFSSRAVPGSDVIVLFSKRLTEVARRFPSLAAKLAPDGGLWVAYPKKSSGVATDLTFEAVQGIGLDARLVDNKSCAIDDVWSAVRFVIRLSDRRSAST